jgi:beta-aspartyl-peptidase (threonine type)
VQIRAGLAAALRLGGDILEQGGSATDAVVAAVTSLEDWPDFNAGHGSVLNRDGHVEMDAALMVGADRRAGAVAAVRSVRNPILLAKAVMEHTEHVLLVAEGADAFARTMGIPPMPQDYFVTPLRLERWRAVRGQNKVVLDHDAKGTVGAVACDRDGHVSAATSTGGLNNKLPGRVGDTALIGSGTWAWDKGCAVSATGYGEPFIRASCGARLSALMDLAGLSLEAAAKRLFQEDLRAVSAFGGLIAVDAAGKWVTPYNSAGMLRGVRTERMPAHVGIWDALVPADGA